MSITFTQYLHPSSNTRPIQIDRSPEIEAMARDLRDAGRRFYAELLRSGEVSLTVEADEDEPPVAIEVVPNDDNVGAAVDRLIQTAAAECEALRAKS